MTSEIAALAWNEEGTSLSVVTADGMFRTFAAKGIPEGDAARIADDPVTTAGWDPSGKFVTGSSVATLPKSGMLRMFRPRGDSWPVPSPSTSSASPTSPGVRRAPSWRSGPEPVPCSCSTRRRFMPSATRSSPRPAAMRTRSPVWRRTRPGRSWRSMTSPVGYGASNPGRIGSARLPEGEALRQTHGPARGHRRNAFEVCRTGVGPRVATRPEPSAASLTTPVTARSTRSTQSLRSGSGESVGSGRTMTVRLSIILLP